VEPTLPTSGEPAKLLVRGVNWLGDAVMTLPAIQRLRERFPQSRITLLTSEKLTDLWRDHGAIDGIISFVDTEGLWSVAKKVRTGGFDTALVLPNSPRSALETWLAGIPTRVGYAGNWRHWLLTRSVKYPTDRVRLRRRGVNEIRRLIQGDEPATTGRPGVARRHQMHDYLYLSASLGANPDPLPPRLVLHNAEIQAAVSLLAQIQCEAHVKIEGNRAVWLGLNPSSAYGPAKRWPLERFAQVTREISRHIPDCIWLVFGTGADKELCEKLVGQARCRMISLAGKTSLRQLMGLLKNCSLLLTNDSGPMHVAAALGTPVIVPFGSTSPELTAPGQPGDPRHHLLTAAAACSPCFRRTCPIDFRCMNEISVEKVLAAVLATIGANS
jgi:heptosyltransferase-2